MHTTSPASDPSISPDDRSTNRAAKLRAGVRVAAIAICIAAGYFGAIAVLLWPILDAATATAV